MTRMHNPAHPGEVLREGVFSTGEATVTDASKVLGVSRVALSRVLHSKSVVSAEMAVRLGKWLNTGAEIWLNMQTLHDLWRAEQALKTTVKKIPRLVHAD